ncbi:transposase [Streptomyces sp. NPDC048362]|uniref:transposase n=1 Tax=Streptomyces sp. NPDC048362 TaxID=3365539 RepID=UPI0037127F98
MQVIEYTLRPSGGDGTVYRLITTLFDPEQAPAEELPALYAQRWEIENTLDEIKNHQGIPGMALRSQHPRGVRQEIFAFLLVHYALRGLMHQAALKDGVPCRGVADQVGGILRSWPESPLSEALLGFTPAVIARRPAEGRAGRLRSGGARL